MNWDFYAALIAGILLSSFLGWFIYSTLEGLMDVYFRNKYLNKFFLVLEESLQKELLHSVSDVDMLYKGVHGLSTRDITYRTGLAKHLRQFVVKMHLGKTQIKDTKKIITLNGQLKKYIEQLEKIEPFIGLPKVERLLMESLLKMIELGDDEETVKKINELSKYIEVKNNLLNSLEKTNKWSKPLAIIGVILTIIFGIASLYK